MELSLSKLPWYAQIGAFVALAVAGVGVFYYLYAGPAGDEIAQRTEKLQVLRADINKGLTIARKLPQFRAQVAELEGRLDSLRAVLPEEKDFGDLLRSIQTLAMQSNLAVKVFKPGAVVTKQMHAEWPINIELDGAYHNLGLFFDRISKFSRIINVGNLAIKAKDKPDPNSTISAQCVATTFVLVEQKAKAPAAAVAVPAALPGKGN